ncbi:MAG: EscU/YscU/HrcU family type III secretion system export apparatus switch protein [Lachnobacterium sp.]|jgi:flagellar biosynthesis protein|uniref:Flagellar biosynthesis protein n=1 Tax=Lachnobacterium bovis DSM 14045 TaxID=1122142 RepID=A0A1H3GV74_9FIRM|nr:EscU/YscU/HrcU family type III secretion system export apparatus switch protein [Lachnobacterium bovis]MBQ1801727.1 EscU/YscU/HrcU family type III secretion system export apparatus switch protein [Lachnobacterium sp.]SDY06548.1 flagellar biosynthesis protein [Lachnobacterium bovis DSM 14045]
MDERILNKKKIDKKKIQSKKVQSSKEVDVSDKKKEKTAVALAYEPGDKAPKILATGKGNLADKIIETAKENEVPLYKDNKLADTLSKLEIGDVIPPELYEIVAEILVFVDDMDKLKAKIA